MNSRPDTMCNDFQQVRGPRGFTLAEMMIALTIFSFVIMAMVYTNLFCLKQDQLVSSKLGASDESRRTLATMSREIRSARAFQVGNGSKDSFTAVTNGMQQIGNALEVYSTPDLNNYTRYYFDTNAGELRRIKSGDTEPTLVAQYLTNSMFFTAEYYNGTLMTDLTLKGVVHVILDFYQYQYPLTKVGPGYLYDRYKMEFRLTTHAPAL
jgi:prepilin-type N-terminal cleavage/methylation domain-containing protein